MPAASPTSKPYFRDKAGELIPVMISGVAHLRRRGPRSRIDRLRPRHSADAPAQQLATAGEIAVSLAHEINNPLESITNNLELLPRPSRPMNESENVVENERLDAIRDSIARVQAIVRRLDEMTRKGVYETRDYLNGKRMADLAPREDGKGQAHPDDAPHLTEESPLRGMSVLVLDDDAAVVNSLADLLRAEQCIVHCATRPSAAFGILRNVKLDAVISDVVMPEMDGYDFYLKVKEEMPQLPVILMTAYYYDKDHILKRSRLRGLEGALFKKPVNPGKLRAMLTQLRQKAALEKAQAKAASSAAKAAAASAATPKPIPQS